MVKRRTLLFGLPAIAAVAVSVPRALGPRVPAPRAERAWPKICVSTPGRLDLSPEQLVAALQRYVDAFIYPVWGVRADLEWSPTAFSSAWNLIVTDEDTDDGDAIAYHEIDTRLPYGIVSSGAALDYDGTVSVATSHELAEMLMNPGINMWAGTEPWKFDGDSSKQLFALELADPVQEFDFRIDGVRMSDFVYPAYFEPWEHPAGTRFDQCGVLEGREIAKGGYQIVRDKEKISDIYHTGAMPKCWRARSALNRR